MQLGLAARPRSDFRLKMNMLTRLVDRPWPERRIGPGQYVKPTFRLRGPTPLGCLLPNCPSARRPGSSHSAGNLDLPKAAISLLRGKPQLPLREKALGNGSLSSAVQIALLARLPAITILRRRPEIEQIVTITCDGEVGNLLDTGLSAIS